VADVDELGDPMLVQQGSELIDAPRRVTDREEALTRSRWYYGSARYA
jgi:hypothetical protein